MASDATVGELIVDRALCLECIAEKVNDRITGRCCGATVERMQR